MQVAIITNSDNDDNAYLQLNILEKKLEAQIKVHSVTELKNCVFIFS